MEIPDAPSGYVLDEANVLSDQTEATLQAELAALDAENSSQMVVVTIATLNDYPIEKYTLELGRSWGVGQEEFNNGLVFLVVTEDHETRIEVGYGLEGAITDAQSSSILNQVAIPYFQEGNYDQGVLESVQILDQLARGEMFDFTATAETDTGILDYLPFLIILFWLLLSWFSNTKGWWMGGIFGAAIGWLILGGLLGFGIGTAAGLLLDYFFSTYLFGKIKPPRSGFFFGGHGGSGGSSGGFGGGGFGGGGASGRW